MLPVVGTTLEGTVIVIVAEAVPIYWSSLYVDTTIVALEEVAFGIAFIQLDGMVYVPDATPTSTETD